MRITIFWVFLTVLTWNQVSGQDTTDKQALFPFELKDTLGRVVKAADFEGKALVMDFWFTGCKGCVQVAEALHKEVMPAFANDSNVVFLSVCLDVNFLQWKRSLRTGMYTNAEQVNLYTMGLGADHPLFRHYRFSGCPQLLIADRSGAVLSVSPALPVVGNRASVNSCIALIDKARNLK